MKNTFTLIFICFLVNLGFAQNSASERCRSGSLAKAAAEKNPVITQKREKIQQSVDQWIREKPARPRMEMTLPIVVHVLYSNESENISDEQIQSQIAVLNEDFNGLNQNFDDTPNAFKSLRGNIGVKFCLASIDPQGNSTNGITRRNVTQNEIAETMNFYSTARGGADAWDNTKYINIWVANQEEGSLGFATLPGTADPPESDGVVIPSVFFGTTGTAANSSPNDLGRTATHEMGHYFGLEHIWGYDGGCQEDDNVADTPNQDFESEGCYTFPYFDGCTTSGNGIMFMNYMDYSDDACMTMFSVGQAKVMQAIINGERAGLVNSGMTACEAVATSLWEIDTDALKIYPNPANNYFLIELDNQTILSNSRLEVLNIDGSLQLENATITKNEVNVSSLSNGIYFVKIITIDKIYVSKLILNK